MNGEVYRAGVLNVAWEMAAEARMALPSEHRIAGTRVQPMYGFDAWLIEGPTMPEVPAGGVPGTVEMRLLNQWTGSLRIVASWRHAPEQRWVVGEWPTYAAFRAALAVHRGV